jgi:hypothetical protein
MVAPDGQISSSARFEMSCQRFHPTVCTQSLRADSISRMVDAAMAHGAVAHGFTPAFYSQERQAEMAADAARHLGGLIVANASAAVP